MMIRVDPSSSVPVYQQIVDEVKSAIARGAASPGEMIPSVRQMAAQALVNPNTVAKAYRDLEREGILYMRKGLGVFVADRAERLSRSGRREEMLDRIRKLIAEARRAGLTAPELRVILADAVRQAFSEPHTENGDEASLARTARTQRTDRE